MDQKQKFKVALKAEGMTQKEFARKIGVSPAMISLFISGKTGSRNVSDKVQDFIAAAWRKIKKAA